MGRELVGVTFPSGSSHYATVLLSHQFSAVDGISVVLPVSEGHIHNE